MLNGIKKLAIFNPKKKKVQTHLRSLSNKVHSTSWVTLMMATEEENISILKKIGSPYTQIDYYIVFKWHRKICGIMHSSHGRIFMSIFVQISLFRQS